MLLLTFSAGHCKVVKGKKEKNYNLHNLQLPGREGVPGFQKPQKFGLL